MASWVAQEWLQIPKDAVWNTLFYKCIIQVVWKGNNKTLSGHRDPEGENQVNTKPTAIWGYILDPKAARCLI